MAKPRGQDPSPAGTERDFVSWSKTVVAGAEQQIVEAAVAPDRIAGLDADADDYSPKPFAVPELLARLRAPLRRAAQAPDATAAAEAGKPGAELRIASLRVDPCAPRPYDAEVSNAPAL